MTIHYRKSLDTPEELAAFYDAKYEEMRGTWHTPPEECNTHLDDLGVPYDHSKTLLDVGSGGGHFLEQAMKRVTCWGIELSHVAIRYSWERVPNVPVYHGDIETHFGHDWQGAFDFITSIGSLEHALNIGVALDEIHRLLRRDGRFYAYLPNELWKHEDQANERTATVDDWTRLLHHHGFQVDSVKRWGVDNDAYVARRV